MKTPNKYLTFIMILICSFSLSSCKPSVSDSSAKKPKTESTAVVKSTPTPKIEITPTPEATPIATTPPMPAKTTPQNITVYKTKYGECYHMQGCMYLKSCIKTTLYAAKQSGLRPCSRCCPPE